MSRFDSVSAYGYVPFSQITRRLRKNQEILFWAEFRMSNRWCCTETPLDARLCHGTHHPDPLFRETGLIPCPSRKTIAHFARHPTPISGHFPKIWILGRIENGVGKLGDGEPDAEAPPDDDGAAAVQAYQCRFRRSACTCGARDVAARTWPRSPTGREVGDPGERLGQVGLRIPTRIGH